MSSFPLPAGPGAVVVPAPAAGPQNWAGAPSAAYDRDGSIVLAYRLRWADGPTDANVIARSADGERFETVVTLDKQRWGAAMVEKPALVRLDGGGWRLYVCCATQNSKHWWIGLLEAETLEELADADVRRIFPGDEAMGVKDPVIQRRDGRWDEGGELVRADRGSRSLTAAASLPPGKPASMRATSRFFRFRAAATGSTTRRGSPTRATSCGRKSFAAARST